MNKDTVESIFRFPKSLSVKIRAIRGLFLRRSVKRMSRAQTVHLAFTTSGVSVAFSVPIAIGLQKPDFPGLVLVVTGGLATLISLRRIGRREFSIPAKSRWSSDSGPTRGTRKTTMRFPCPPRVIVRHKDRIC